MIARLFARRSVPHFARLAALALAVAVAAPAQAIPKAAEHADAPVTYGAETTRPKPIKAQQTPATKGKGKTADKAAGKSAASGTRTTSRTPVRSTGK